MSPKFLKGKGRKCFGSLWRWTEVWFLLVTCPLRAAASDPLVRLQVVASGVWQPVFVTHAGDGSGRLFIVEQDGRILVFRDGQVLPRPFLDITARVESLGEKGLLGLAFHPSFRSNGRFFVNYTRSSAGLLQTVIAEYRASTINPDVADSSERVILEFGQPFENHNGGMIAFGPDGYLYIGSGDGGSAGDPFDNGQRTDTLLGKVLRIDVDRGTPYAIPLDNPFVDRPGARGEIWTYGLRNPWRFSFDRLTGRLLLGDVGQSAREEVDMIVRGSNYGWRIMEGSACFSPSSDCNRAGLLFPIAEYKNPDEGTAVIGGYVYRGLQETSLRGAYIFGDLSSSRIWSLVEAGPDTWKRKEILRTNFPISSFGEDEQGELYVVDYGGATGSIRRMMFGSTHAFPHVPDGGGYTTTFTFTNTSSFTSEATLDFFRLEGTPRQITLVGLSTGSSFPIQVPAGATRVLRTSGVTPGATSGMALLRSVPTMASAVTFRFSTAGQLRALATVLDAQFSSRFTIPVTTVAPAEIAVAIANPGDTDLNLRIALIRRDGAVIETADLPQLNPLPAKAQVALLVSQIGFKDAAALSDGSLVVFVQGVGEASVMALLLEDGLLSTMPVILTEANRMRTN
ncbi:MAG: PQQ-dependent sugar dehydrogenase [Acidobacteria bacterium]|nr:PQQ-dependent sugar dehydrogenase [Acidobacteriota bacterium]